MLPACHRERPMHLGKPSDRLCSHPVFKTLGLHGGPLSRHWLHDDEMEPESYKPLQCSAARAFSRCWGNNQMTDVLKITSDVLDVRECVRLCRWLRSQFRQERTGSVDWRCGMNRPPLRPLLLVANARSACGLLQSDVRYRRAGPDFGAKQPPRSAQ